MKCTRPKPLRAAPTPAASWAYSMIDLATADRATVEERLAAGESAEEAEAGFLTDEYFEAWYQSLCDALSQYEG